MAKKERVTSNFYKQAVQVYGLPFFFILYHNSHRDQVFS